MAYRRSYTPEFDMTEEWYIDSIQRQMERENTKFVYKKNDAPYDMLDDKQVITEHITLRYQQDAPWDILRELEQKMIIDGYTVQEMSPRLKSIKLPHRHYIKLKQVIKKTSFATQKRYSTDTLHPHNTWQQHQSDSSHSSTG